MNPYIIVDMFEKEIAEYCGSKYAVAVDSCTNAILLSCLYVGVKEVCIPKKTYCGVATSIINAGGVVKFEDIEWDGEYTLKPYNIIDSARRFRRNIYTSGTLRCLSFHFSKHLPIGHGGCILTDDVDAYNWLKKARFDGRSEGIPIKKDRLTLPAYHVYMTPDEAARGLMLLSVAKDYYEDLPEKNYSDLSKQEIFG